MTIRKIAILSLALLLPFTIEAQKKKKRVVKKPTVEVVEEPEEDPRITNMREMTQQIIIIDSIVADKDKFLASYRLSSETGSLTTTSQFFGKHLDGYAFLNEMGNKVYFSKPDDNDLLRLYTSDKLGSDWSEASRLQGLDEGISEASYPFMLNDGITLYFAAKGDESIGGYDIFFTRYDSRSASFLRPENMGMPFNSEANDYMFAVDEQSRIGYFVSDRRQPEDKVCVYIFVPSDTRRTYDPSVYSEQQIRDFADIISIADTWGDGSERKAALERLKNISTVQTASISQIPTHKTLVINDQLTYSDYSDFRSLEARGLYDQLLKSRQRQESLNNELNKSRERYAKGSDAERKLLGPTILHNEEQLFQLNEAIRSLEKKIRNAENAAIQQL